MGTTCTRNATGHFIQPTVTTSTSVTKSSSSLNRNCANESEVQSLLPTTPQLNLPSPRQQAMLSNDDAVASKDDVLVQAEDDKAAGDPVDEMATRIETAAPVDDDINDAQLQENNSPEDVEIPDIMKNEIDKLISGSLEGFVNSWLLEKLSGAVGNPTQSTSGQKFLQRLNEKNFEDFVVVWLDNNISNTSDNQNASIELRKIVNRLECFDEADGCIKYIRAVDDEKVFFIVSGSLDQRLVASIHDLPQLNSVYVFYQDQDMDDYQKWTEAYEKVVGVYNNISAVCEQLQKDTKDASTDMLTINVKGPSHTNHTHRQEASFMYAQFLKENLVKFDSSPETKQEMINFCRDLYSDNPVELKFIDEFETKYVKERAIWWYTRESFLYRILNKALRTQDVDVLYKLRYFLKDLNNLIEEKHTQWLGENLSKSELHLYRGRALPKEEFKMLNDNVGGFMSVTNFLSTSEDENIARGFISPTTTKVGVLLVIKIDVHGCKTPFAYVGDQTQFEHEKEILFTMGAVFRIESVVYSADKSAWVVSLSLAGEEDEELRALTQHMRKDGIVSSTSLYGLATVMSDIGNYDKAEKYYQLALEDALLSNDLRYQSAVYNNLGSIYDKTGQTQKAIEYYEKSLEIKLQHLPATDLSLAHTYNNLGLIYIDRGVYDKALSYFKKALVIDMHGGNLEKAATDYNNIGEVYNAVRRYAEALEMYGKALEIKLEVLPANHPSLAATYTGIGGVYSAQNDYKKASEYSKKALEIFINSLPSDHPTIALGYENLAVVEYKQGELKDALEHIKKAHEIYSKRFPQTRGEIDNAVTFIGMIQQKLRAAEE